METQRYLSNGTIGYAFMVGGLAANLVAVLSVAAAGFTWVGKIDARLEITRQELVEIKQAERAMNVRIGLSEQAAAASEQRLKSIEQHLVELRAEVRKLSGSATGAR